MEHRQKDWKKLCRHVRKHGIKLVLVDEEKFGSRYDPDIRSLFDPFRETIFFNKKTLKDPDIALFSLAHELGHAIDHMSEPHLSREYGLHYNLSVVYANFEQPTPEASRRIFQVREDMANDLAESVLEELEIAISLDAREVCIHH